MVPGCGRHTGGGPSGAARGGGGCQLLAVQDYGAHAQPRGPEPPPRFRPRRRAGEGLGGLQYPPPSGPCRLTGCLSTEEEISVLGRLGNVFCCRVHQNMARPPGGPKTGFCYTFPFGHRPDGPWVRIQGPLPCCGPLTCRGCPLSVSRPVTVGPMSSLPAGRAKKGGFLLRHSHIFTFPSAATAFDGGLRWADAPSTWFPGPKKTLTRLRCATCTTRQG